MFVAGLVNVLRSFKNLKLLCIGVVFVIILLLLVVVITEHRASWIYECQKEAK